MGRTWLVMILVVVVLVSHARGGSIVDPESGAADEVYVAPSGAWPESVPIAEAPMAVRLAGFVARIEPVELRRLRLATDERQPIPADAQLEPACFLLAVGRDGATKRLAVGHDRISRKLVAWEWGVESGHLAVLPDRPWEERVAAWRRVAEVVQPVPRSAGLDGRLDPPYVEGWPFLDEETFGRRVFGGRRTGLTGSMRTLSNEQLHIRIPNTLDPYRPAGLLVWVNAGPRGDLPYQLDAACDALGLICIGAANAGNDRLTVERMQLALDGVATAMARHHVDENRIYVAGISGGGRVASVLAACFPDIFKGSAPVIGLNIYRRVKLEDGTYIKPQFSRPAGDMFRLFRGHRMAVVTGSEDFNGPHIRPAVELLQRDGVDVRLFDYDGMDHRMPSSERMLEVLRWMDEPARTAIAESDAEAARLLEFYLKRYGEGPPGDDERRREALNRVMEAGPWSDAAWRAYRLLEAARTDAGTTGER
jgi:hypothetical protein